MREQNCNFVKKHIKKCCTATALILFLALPLNLITLKPVYADPCNVGSCIAGVISDHEKLRTELKKHISKRFNEHRDWLVDDFFEGQVLPAMMLMTEQLSAVAMQQTMIMGTFLDAKHQLETQRLFNELQTEAHRDYQPSKSFCTFGTNVRSMANSESIGRYNALVNSRRQFARHLGQKNISGASDRNQDKLARWEMFKELFCDPQDNNWLESNASTGLALACGSGSSHPDYTNADVDYTRLIENARTINLERGHFAPIDYSAYQPSRAEQAVMALGNNLYGHNVLTRTVGKEKLKREQFQHMYLALRSVAAKRNVAENSFNAIIGMKSAGTTDMSSSGDPDTWKFLGAIMTELGMPESEARTMIGLRPSYYAQLEIMAKRIYQNPDFYANLYDKPANVKRKSVALKAIELMLDRAIYESQIRQEMATSVLLASRLREPFRDVNKELQPGK